MTEQLKVVLTAEIADLKKNLQNAQKEIKDLSSKGEGNFKKFSEAAKKAGAAVANGLKVAAAATVAAGAALVALSEGTKEYRTNQAKLTSAFEAAGASAEVAKTAYNDLYRVLGDDGQATEAAAHLAKLTTNEQELAEWTNICQGVYATFGDSLPIEGLTEAANETAKVGTVTGGLADALNWAGISEDEFNNKLAACNDEAEREKLIRETLNGVYSEAAASYEENAKSILDANEAQAKLTDSFAALGGAVEPIVSLLKNELASILQELTPYFGVMSEGLQGIINGIEGSADKLSSGIGGALETLLAKISDILPQVLNTGVQIIMALLNGIVKEFPNIVNTVVALLPVLVAALVEVIPKVTEALLNALPVLLDAAVDLITSLADGIVTLLPILIDQIITIIPILIQKLIDSIPALLEAAILLLTAIVDAVPLIIPPLIEMLPVLIDSLVITLLENLPILLDAAVELLNALIDAIPVIIPLLVEALPRIIDSVVDFIFDSIPILLKAAVELFMALVRAVIEIIPPLIKAIAQIIATIITNLVDKIREIFNNIKNIMSDKVNEAKSAVVNKFNEIKTNITNKVTEAKNSVLGIFDNIKNGITQKIASARDTIKDIVEKIKGFFKFNIELPKIKLPHFTIKPAGWKIGDLLQGTIPKLGISWYAKGGVFDKPTLFSHGGGLGGLGENGAEAVVPLENNLEWLDKLANMLSARMGNTPIVLQVDGKTFAKTSISTINNLTKQTGKLGLVVT